MEALRVKWDVSSWNVGTRTLAIGAVVTAFLISLQMEELFSFTAIATTRWDH